MLLRAVIIDDEQKGINALKILIEKHVAEVKVVAESTSPAKGIELIENYKPEIVFLDINMPEFDGFELLKKLSWKDFNLVFTTAHREHGLRALKNNAIDYLLKPIDPKDLKFAVDKIKQQLALNPLPKFNYNDLVNSINSKSRLILPVRSGIESIDTNEILYLESVSNYTTIHLNSLQQISSSKTLKEFDLQLCDGKSGFMRVHQSFIVNLSKIQRYLKIVDKIIMENDQKIPLAKSRKEEFFKWMGIG
jgi:two-component system, LytTR family, response regulator